MSNSPKNAVTDIIMHLPRPLSNHPKNIDPLRRMLCIRRVLRDKQFELPHYVYQTPWSFNWWPFRDQSLE